MPITVMLDNLSRNWMWVALRGLVAMLFGIFALIWPGITLAALVIVWGVYAIADGVCAVIAAFQARDRGKPFGSLTIVGVLGIAAGVIALVWPGMTAYVLLIFIAAWAIAMGIFQVAAAFRLRREIENEWLLAL